MLFLLTYISAAAAFPSPAAPALSSPSLFPCGRRGRMIRPHSRWRCQKQHEADHSSAGWLQPEHESLSPCEKTNQTMSPTTLRAAPRLMLFVFPIFIQYFFISGRLRQQYGASKVINHRKDKNFWEFFFHSCLYQNCPFFKVKMAPRVFLLSVALRWSFSGAGSRLLFFL